uniref:Short-chain dehydrogenase/reductase SDR n=1 Tax=Solibacter usitatus (strain Ellin6076) TaxID=234267 RepID=Q023I9_SOLUE
MREKVLIITGSTGIGAETVRMTAARGARIVIATGDEISGFELAAETGAECWAGDLTLANSADSVLTQCLSKFGRVDGLFNVAGLSGRRFGDGPVHEIQDDAWHTTLSHNLTLAFRMCRAVTGRMLEQEGGGAIVNMGSVLADSPEPRHFATHAYAAAKGAVAAMTKSMAAYYAPHGIRINLIAPGLVRTPAGERTQADPAFQEFVRKKQPLNSGMIEVAEVARAAVFLLSEESRSVTGEVFTIDGGWRLSGV